MEQNSIRRRLLCAFAASSVGAFISFPACAQSPYAVAGLHLGDDFNTISGLTDLHCEPSELFQSLTWCMGRSQVKGANGQLSITTAVLHAASGQILYAWKMIDPAFFAPGDIDREIDRLSKAFRQPPSTLRMPTKAGLPNGVIVTWGGVQLEPLSADSTQMLAVGSSPHKEIMVDFLGNFRRSAQEGLPVYLIAGGAGMIYSAISDDKGRGNLRLAIADPSRFSISSVPLASPAPPPTPQLPNVVETPAAVPVPTPTPQISWGALSVASDGATGTAWNEPSQQEALDSAVQGCRSGSQNPDTCVWAIVSGSNWAAGVWCYSDSVMRGSPGTGNSAKEAISNAFKGNLQDGSFVKDQCKLTTIIAADGSQLKFPGNQ